VAARILGGAARTPCRRASWTRSPTDSRPAIDRHLEGLVLAGTLSDYLDQAEIDPRRSNPSPESLAWRDRVRARREGAPRRASRPRNAKGAAPGFNLGDGALRPRPRGYASPSTAVANAAAATDPAPFTANA
jgi:hypothetical protein